MDLDGFGAWLREQLPGKALSAVVAVVMQILRALFAQNTQLRQRLLGGRKKPPSERLRALSQQLAFTFTRPSNDVTPVPAAQPAPAADSEPSADPKARSKNKSGRGNRARKPLPGNITVVTVPNNVPAEQRQCPACDVEMKEVATRTVDTWEIIPAQIVLQRRVDQTVACPKCDAIVSAKAPNGILDGGILGPTIVTEALANKILDGLPIERQARNFQREGAPIIAATLGRSVGALLDQLVPLARCVKERVKACEIVQLDSTGLRVLDPSAVAGIHRDTLWTLIGDQRWVYFAALYDGDGDALEELMRDADAEAFQCDGTSTTNFIEKKWNRCRPGCHAHARRKLAEAARLGDLRAMIPLNLYARIFAIEQNASAEGLDAEARQRRREVESAPLFDQLRDWVLRTAPGVEPSTPLGKALTYLQRQWMRLCLLLVDGRIAMTNNRSERELRPWVLGQHTWLFVADQANAERWAAGFTLLHTALAHGVSPRAYLRAVVAKLLAGHSHTRLDELLPDRMLREQPDLADPVLRVDAVSAKAA